MRRIVRRTIVVLTLVLPATAATGADAQTGPQETEVTGVTSEVVFARQYNGALHLGILFKNTTGQAVRGSAITFDKFTVVESGGRKHFPLKDPDGHYVAGPVSDWNGGGRFYMVMPAHGQALVWADFDPVNGQAIDVSLPLSQPFDAVTVTTTPPASREVTGALGVLTMSLVSATRTEGQLKVRLKIANPGTAAADGAVEYQDAYLLDPSTKQKYAVVKDTDGNYLAQPLSDTNHGGRYWLSYVKPHAQTFMALTFTAPPAATAAVDIVIPRFPPVENVTPSGMGSGGAGEAVAGRTVGLQQALQDLHADVSDRRVKVNLAADVLFDFDSAALKPDAEPELTKVATVVDGYPGATVRIDGFTDAKGTDAYNRALSEKRAAAVAVWLTAHAKLAASQVHTSGRGAADPVAPNTKPDGTDNPEGRAKNRRVEITITRGKGE